MQISYMKELQSVELKLKMYCKQIDYKHFVKHRFSIQKNMRRYIFYLLQRKNMQFLRG